jgi:hypothetical protein
MLSKMLGIRVKLVVKLTKIRFIWEIQPRLRLTEKRLLFFNGNGGKVPTDHLYKIGIVESICYVTVCLFMPLAAELDCSPLRIKRMRSTAAVGDAAQTFITYRKKTMVNLRKNDVRFSLRHHQAAKTICLYMKAENRE